jgi:hypothetical protein
MLNGPKEREQAATWVFQAKPGSRFELRDPSRSREQNARLWVMLTTIAKQLDWFGKRYSPEAWHDYFMNQYRGVVWMPDELGGMVPVGRSTSELTVKEHHELTQLIEAFAARQGIAL